MYVVLFYNICRPWEPFKNCSPQSHMCEPTFVIANVALRRIWVRYPWFKGYYSAVVLNCLKLVNLNIITNLQIPKWNLITIWSVEYLEVTGLTEFIFLLDLLPFCKPTSFIKWRQSILLVSNDGIVLTSLTVSLLRYSNYLIYNIYTYVLKETPSPMHILQ